MRDLGLQGAWPSLQQGAYVLPLVVDQLHYQYIVHSRIYDMHSQVLFQNQLFQSVGDFFIDVIPKTTT